VGNASALAWFFFVMVLIFVLFLFKSAKYWVYFPDQEQG
jgi:oligogalacturonide transport system permease protein